MGTVHTLDNKMHSTDVLVLSCRACGHVHRASKKAAQRRYGSHATGYYIEQTSKCPRCGGQQITAAIDRGGALRA